MTRLTPRDRRAVLLVVLVAAACGVALTLRGLAAAQRSADGAAAAHTTAIAQVRRIRTLRAADEVAADRPRPSPDLVARLRAVMQDAGIDPGRLVDVRTAEPRPVRGTEYQLQSATLTLRAVEPAALAQFLVGWRTAEPLWAVSSIRADRHTGGGGGAGGAGRARSRGHPRNEPGRDEFDITLTIENVHLARPAPDGRTAQPEDGP